MAEIIFDKLGNFTEQDCKNIKKMMEGKTYYDFKVSWSCYAGNCNLIAKASCPIDESEDAKRMFLHSAVGTGADAFSKMDFMVRYGNAHIKEHYDDKVLVCMKKWDFYFFYFDDARIAKTLCDTYHEFVDEYGCVCVSVSKYEFESTLASEAERQHYRLTILEE